MSVTTTANAHLLTLRQTLADYDLHHSEHANPSHPSPAPAPNNPPAPSTSNPSDWDSSHRRVPPYRPVRRENLGPERDTYNNGVERAFVFVMLNGVGLQSLVSHGWRATGAKVVGPNWFKAKVGGEW